MLSGQLSQGDRLPSTRALALELGVSRTSILLAFDELRADGLVEGKVGSGTRIARKPPTSSSNWPPDTMPSPNPGDTSEPGGAPRAFRINLPGIDLFPSALWGQLASRRWRAASPGILDYADSAGYLPLRRTIAEYLARTRSLGCSPDQVFIVGGSQQALDLIARTMAGWGDVVWMEDPGYPGARDAFVAAGASVFPVPVDEQGFQLNDALETAPNARFAYLTPSHQFPLTVVLSSKRREGLLRWAAGGEGWIIEDDYDWEFRALKDRLPAMAASAEKQRVFYVGTFSKTVFPSLRLGYLVVPSTLIERFRETRQITDRHSATIQQAILADFIWEGHYDRHLRRMRRAYQQRGEALCRAISRELAHVLAVTLPPGGTHLLAWLPPRIPDGHASEAAARHGIEALPLSMFSRRTLDRGALLLGFAGLRDVEIADAVRGLRNALASENLC
ncbi:MAG: PLP-dependent aminotransferase family protein [Gemmatimonadota bacterium]